jgi:hypothetical protein
MHFGFPKLLKLDTIMCSDYAGLYYISLQTSEQSSPCDRRPTVPALISIVVLEDRIMNRRETTSGSAYASGGCMTFMSSPKCSSIDLRKYSLLPNPPTSRMAETVKLPGASSTLSICSTISWKIACITLPNTSFSSEDLIRRFPFSMPSSTLFRMLEGTLVRNQNQHGCSVTTHLTNLEWSTLSRGPR